jgi:3D (Asp-Asp-Asp) domain-containing protein
MSQRGQLIEATQACVKHWWSLCNKTIVFTLAFALTSTFALTAQDTSLSAPQKNTVTIRVDGTERTVTTQKDTVQTLLHQEFIALNEHDRCVPALHEPVVDGMTVTITRVTKEVVVDRVTIAPHEIVRWDRRMTTNPVVIEEGASGVSEVTRVIWKKDGVVTQNSVQKQVVVQKPRPRIVVRGNLPSRGLHGRRVMSVVATAYDPGPGSCGKYADGRTAIGMRAGRGVIAVDPRVIPLGTRVYVDGYGPAIAADTGGAIKGNKIDVCFPTRSEALKWGRRTVKLVILE